MAVVVDRIAGGGGVSIPVSLTTATGATTTEGILLGTSSVATVGAQKFSPALHFQGSGWKTDATAGAQSCDWKVEVQPVRGAASPDGKLVFSSSVNGGAYTGRWIMDEVTAGASYGFFPGANSNTGLIPWTNSDLVVGVLASYHWRFTPASSGAAGTPVTFMGGAANVFGWSSAGGATNSIDTGLSRISAGVVGVGTGAAGSIAGGLSMNNFTLNGYYVVQSAANAAQLTYSSASELLTLSTGGTTTDTSANLLPANAIIVAVVARVTTTITTATSWQLGDPTTAGRFTAANSTMVAGTTDVGTLHYDGTGAAGQRQVAAAKVRVTTVGTPGAGAIRITVFYYTILPPQS